MTRSEFINKATVKNIKELFVDAEYEILFLIRSIFKNVM